MLLNRCTECTGFVTLPPPITPFNVSIIYRDIYPIYLTFYLHHQNTCVLGIKRLFITSISVRLRWIPKHLAGMPPPSPLPPFVLFINT